MPFELKEVTECRLLHVNHRKEFHGDEQVLAVDLNFEKEGGNELLDLLDEAIRTALYFNRAATSGQENLPEVLAVLPNLRLPQLNGQKFKWGDHSAKLKGYRFVLDYGLGDEQSNVEFADSSVGKFEFETKEGGTVVLRWQLSYAGDAITESTLFKLIDHEQKAAHVTLSAGPNLQLVKGGKTKTAPQPSEDDGQQSLTGDKPDGGNDDDEADELTPEGALTNSLAG